MLQAVTIEGLTESDVEKLREVFPSLEVQRKAVWSFPIGDSKVLLTIEGPVFAKERDVLQYAIDVLEVAKKNSSF